MERVLIDTSLNTEPATDMATRNIGRVVTAFELLASTSAQIPGLVTVEQTSFDTDMPNGGKIVDGDTKGD